MPEVDPFEDPEFRGKSEDLNTTSGLSRQALDTFVKDYNQGRMDTLKQMSDLMAGNLPIDPKGLDPSLGDLVEKLKSQQDAFVKVCTSLDPNFQYYPLKSPADNMNNASNKTTWDKIVARAQKVFGKDPAAAGKKLSEKAESETDTQKRKDENTVADLLKVGALYGSGLLAALFAAAKAKSGCYQYKPGVSSSTKLDCGSNEMSADNCNCTEDFATLQGLCPSVQSDQTCTPDGFRYSYQNYGIFDIVNSVIQVIGDDENKAAGSIQAVLDFLSKYGIYIVIGIVLLIAIQSIISLVKSFKNV